MRAIDLRAVPEAPSVHALIHARTCMHADDKSGYNLDLSPPTAASNLDFMHEQRAFR